MLRHISLGTLVNYLFRVLLLHSLQNVLCINSDYVQKPTCKENLPTILIPACVSVLNVHWKD